MARKRKEDPDQLGLLEARVATAPLVPGIREKVKAWREGGYKGITDTTRILLNYWFYTDHRLPNGGKFAYHYFQREAVETLVYLYEVAKVRRHKSLVETFATRSDLRLLQYDDFARYCVKMATGSGKTKVMSLAIAWQFFNAVAEARDDFAKTFLLIAPNVIVFERLRTDFEGGRIFRADPVVPPEMKIYWYDFQCYMRGEGERASSLGALYLANVQQFYERQNGGQDEPEELTAVLGPKPPAQDSGIEDFDKRIVDRGGPVVVLSDEAQYVTVKTFVEALRKMVITELAPELVDAGRPLSGTPPFPWSRATLAAEKCIFNLVPCDNEYRKGVRAVLAEGAGCAALRQAA